MSIIDRFNQKVERIGDCWIWKGALFDNGYGAFYYEGKNRKAHRVSYILFKGNVPSNMYVLHSCDNRACVNPDHLVVGTHQDNMRDMVSKHRSAIEKNGHAKATWADVRDIRELREKGESYWTLSKTYNVSYDQVYAICTYRSWKVKEEV